MVRALLAVDLAARLQFSAYILRVTLPVPTGARDELVPQSPGTQQAVDRSTVHAEQDRDVARPQPLISVEPALDLLGSPAHVSPSHCRVCGDRSDRDSRSDQGAPPECCTVATVHTVASVAH